MHQARALYMYLHHIEHKTLKTAVTYTHRVETLNGVRVKSASIALHIYDHPKVH